MFTNLEELKTAYHVRPASMADAQAVVDLFHVCSQALGIKDELSLEETTSDWASPSFNFETDSLSVWDNGRLIAYCDLWGATPPFLNIHRIARVDPQYTKRGIGWVLNRWSEGRARDCCARAEENMQTAAVTHINGANQAAIQLLKDQGAEAVRFYLVMERDLSDPIPATHLPDGYELIQVDPQDYREIYQLKEETFNDHWGHIASGDEAGYGEFKTDSVNHANFEPDLMWAVVKNGQKAGFITGLNASSYGDDFGWISTLGVKREARQKGLGRAMLLHFFDILAKKGKKKVALAVDADSLTNATRVYESVGMKVGEHYVRMEKVLRQGVDVRVSGLSATTET